MSAVARLDASTRDLLGVLAYGELTAFERLAADASYAPSVRDKATLGAMAVAEFGHHRRLAAFLEDAGVDLEEAMAPFVAPLDAFHDSTRPKDWLEGLMKAYIGEGLATDFYREVAGRLSDEATRALVLEVLADTGHAEFTVARVRAAIAAEPAVAGRLALWGRRIMGEALIEAQRVAVQRDALIELLVGEGDLAGVARLLSRLTDNHTARMAALGLDS